MRKDGEYVRWSLMKGSIQSKSKSPCPPTNTSSSIQDDDIDEEADHFAQDAITAATDDILMNDDSSRTEL
ncbi:unnamed protein product [Rotaria socialis]|uniref:Uncharacterized protein n=1 Tax=Rotaria socialis TaxID=392032 RepID=A0A821IF01_9BILA|nr:unnamed protein product [Rotaria socialis]